MSDIRADLLRLGSGPWEVHHFAGSAIAGDSTDAGMIEIIPMHEDVLNDLERGDGATIAARIEARAEAYRAAVAAIPERIAEVERLRARVAELEAEVERLRGLNNG